MISPLHGRRILPPCVQSQCTHQLVHPDRASIASGGKESGVRAFRIGWWISVRPSLGLQVQTASQRFFMPRTACCLFFLNRIERMAFSVVLPWRIGNLLDSINWLKARQPWRRVFARSETVHPCAHLNTLPAFTAFFTIVATDEKAERVRRLLVFIPHSLTNDGAQASVPLVKEVVIIERYRSRSR